MRINESLGEAYLQMDDKKRALEAFQRAIDVGSQSSSVRKKVEQLKH
jgi:hypothetical protein